MAQTPASKPATPTTRPESKPASKPEAPSLPTVVVLDTESCRKLLAKQPRTVPGADYVPGVDAQGRAVAPADLAKDSGRAVAPADLPNSGSGSALLDPRFGIQLKFTLEQLLGSRAPTQAKNAELTVGKLELDPMSGRLSFQQQPVEKPAEDAVVAACREHLAKLPKKR